MLNGKLSKIWVIAICLVAVASVGGAYGLGLFDRVQEEPPQVLNMAMIPTEDIEAMAVAFDPTRQYLERELGMEVNMFKATDYTAVVEAMRAGKVDIAFYGPFTFVLAAERANARAIVAGGKDGKVDVYHSILITHKDSGLRNMEDVKNRVGELTISFVDPASTSGHLVPEGYLRSIGIGSDAFREAVFSGGHDASILAVGAQMVDLGATWEGPFERAIEAGLVTPEDVFVLWRSEGIPNLPIAVRGDLDEALIQRIQQAFLDLPQKDPVAFQQLTEEWGSSEGYVKVTNEDYDFIRLLAESLDKI